MDKQHKNLAQRVLAAILCVAMLLPVFPQTAWAEEESNLVIREQTSDPILAAASTPVNAESVLSGIPYQGGAGSNLLVYDCGNGLTNNGAKSCIRIIQGTTEAEFNTYCSTVLAAKGLNRTYSNETASNESGKNLFRKYMAADGSYSVYTYYLPDYDEARIIVDTNWDTVNGYSYTPQTGASVEPKMVVWGLSTSSSGYHIDTSVSGGNTGRENNGSLIIIRMKDNSLFFHDGGILAQMSDAEAAELLAFCRELTGTTGTTQKMVINTWFVSHAHDDHFQAFGRFIGINHAHFDLKNVVYNIDLERPSVTKLGGIGTTPATKDLREALEVITCYYPNVNYYKPHTGETFDVAGVKFDVLYTHEDRLCPNASHQLAFHQDTLSDNNIDILDLGGTYRSSVLKNASTGQTDFNDTSTVIKVRFVNGVSSILYADMNLAESILEEIYPTSALKTDIMMVPHHLFDSHTDLVRYADAKVYLCMQSKAPIYGNDGNYTTNDTGTRDSLRKNFKAMKDTLTNMGRTEGTNYKVFWGGSETVTIDINKLGSGSSSYYTTQAANDFAYTGWTLFDGASSEDTQDQTGVSSRDGYEDPASKTSGTSITSTKKIYFTRITKANNLIQEGRYLLMSNDGKYIMSHDPTAPADISDMNNEQYGSASAGSLVLDADGNSENTFYIDSSDRVYLDHSDRHFAIWNLRQYAQRDYNSQTGAEITKTAIANGNNLEKYGWANFNTTTRQMYLGIELQKRTKSNDPYNAPYWYSTGAASELLHLCYLSDSTPFKNAERNAIQAGLGKNTRPWFICEPQEDGTFLFYFKKSDLDYRFITCDAYGNWTVKRFNYSTDVATKNAIIAAMDSLKIRLYKYTETSGTKQVAVSGYTVYNVDPGTSRNAILNAIMEHVVVTDPNCKNQYIPCSGISSSTAKVGYYWVDAPTTMNTNATGSHQVTIKYRNDAGSDIAVDTVTVNVVASISNNSGMVSQNAEGAVHVYENGAAIADYVTIRHNGKTINVTMDMLRQSNGSHINTSTANQTYTGVKVVYEGVTYSTNFTLRVGNGTIDVDYPEYPEPGSVTVGKGSTTSETSFSGTGVAHIELSATAKPIEKGVDLIFILDLSSSMRYYKTQNTYACGPAYNTNGVKNTLTYQQYLSSYNTSANLQEFKDEYLMEHPNATDAEMEALFSQSFDAEVVKKVWQQDWWIYTRMYALEESLKSTIKTLRESGQDVKVAIADFGDLNHYEFDGAMLDGTVSTVNRPKYFLNADTSSGAYLEREMSNHLNFILGRDNTYSGTAIPQPYHIDGSKWGGQSTDTGTLDSFIYTNVNNNVTYANKGTVNDGAAAFQDVSTLTDARMLQIVEMLRMQNGNKLGTNYDLGLETAYRLAYAKQKANEAANEDRDIVCIFMSDGAAMQYNFLSGRSQSEAWSQCIIGETDELVDTQNVADKYVITSKFFDNSIKQAPALKEMGQRMYNLLIAGNLRKAGNANQLYPKYTGSNKDFFVAMQAVGVTCNWELFFQIAYTNYTFAEGNQDWYNALKLTGNGIQSISRDANFYERTMEIVIKQLRQPSFKANGEQYKYQTLSPFYYFYNTEGKNWWAEALKGDKDAHYPVPNRKAKSSDSIINTANGDVLNNFSTGTGLALDGKNYISGVQGLDVDLYTIGFSMAADNAISYEEESKVLDNVASGPTFHYEANSTEGLTAVLKAITSTMSTSATNAFFTDTMGEDFDLSTEKTVKNKNGQNVTVNADPIIRVLEYTLDESSPIMKDGKIVGYNRAKDANGNFIYSVREQIKFVTNAFEATSDKFLYQSGGSKVAYSDQVYSIDGNGVKTYLDIWDDNTNMITGKYVRYNANKYVDETNTGTVNLDLDATDRVFPLPAESFFWIIGVLGETEMVLEYQVYLEGSIEGKHPYIYMYHDTNEEAKLTYTDYMGNVQTKDTVTPKFPWGEEAEVGYGFYLVDQFGNPITSGYAQTNFAGSHKLTEITYQDVEQNSTTLDAKTLFAASELNSNLYELYSPDAEYTVKYNEQINDKTYNYWETTDSTNTTYVATNVATNGSGNYVSGTTNYNPNNPNANMDNSVVYFAVRLIPKAKPEVIVIDFGQPVYIDVLHDDELSTGSTLVGINVANTHPSNGVAPNSDYVKTAGKPVQDQFGDVTFYTSGENANRVKYSIKTMEMFKEDVFSYVAKDKDTGLYYYATVTVVPATTIYYEDDFVTFKSHNRADGSLSNTSVWSDSGKKVDKTQAQDRPGEDVNNALGNLDADNVYGYDGAYKEFNAHSQGYAKKATVNANTYGTATFSFYGTGFDVISLSNKTTGTIVVSVYDYTEYDNFLKGKTANKPASKKDAIVDTYYGYKYENGSWVVDPTESATLYQVPVVKVSDLTYGRYTAVITISYTAFFDHQKDGSYDFYLDAIRIYDPANDGNGNNVIKDAYVADGEGWPEYFELRNLLINKNDFDSINNSTTDSVPGIIFIDGFPALQNSNGNHTNDSSSANLGDKSAAVKDYANFGPNNELYLAQGQAVAFRLSIPESATAKVASIHLSLKSVGGSAYVKVYDVNNSATNVIPGEPTTSGTGEKGGRLINTATDLYYDITSLNNKTVVIINTGENAGILSITNIKVTYTAEYSNNINKKFFTSTKQMARAAILSINDLFANVGEQDPGEVVNGTINIAGASLSFEDEILTNLYYTLSGVEATEMGLLTWSAEPADGTIDNAENVFVGAKYDAQKDRYMVQTSGIAAKNLGDTIYMRVYAKTAEGVVYSDLVTYSPKQYAMSRLEKSTNADMKALCVAMLNYGAAAQQYFGYKTDALMNAELTAEQKALASDYSADLFAGAVKADGAKIGAFTKTDGFATRSASVSFDGAFAINYYFAPNAKMNGDMTFYYWSAEDYANADVLTAENATGTSVMELTDNGSYWANITGIAAKQLDETFYVAAVYADADGNTYCTGVIAYSLSTYCMKNAVEGNAMKQLAEATAVYGYHASVYFGDEA